MTERLRDIADPNNPVDVDAPKRKRRTSAEVQAIHDKMYKAAKDILAVGEKYDVNIHIFGAREGSKEPRYGTHGLSDAIGRIGSRGQIQTNLALTPWTGKYKAANPMIQPSHSGLVAIDIDHGLEDCKTTEEILAKAEANGLPRTFTIKTGRANIGATFLYRGVRTLPDCSGLNGFNVGDLSGDIKFNGYVAAPGALHSSGTFYEAINDQDFAPVTDFWRDYTNSTTDGSDETNEAEWKKQAESDPLQNRAYSYFKRQQIKLLKGKAVKIKSDELVPQGYRFKACKRQAGIWRKRSDPPELIRIALDMFAVERCENGREFIQTHKLDLDQLAKWSESWEPGDIILEANPDEKPQEHVFVSPSKSNRHQLLVEAIKKFPDMITAKEARTRFETALAGTGFKLPRQGSYRISRAFEEAGFASRRLNSGWVWQRPGSQAELHQPINTDVKFM
jgi:hypothetical protein